jgi:hypothetical protein
MQDEGALDNQTSCVWFKSNCVCHQNPRISVEKNSSLIIAKILDNFTVPESTSSRHLFFGDQKRFSKEEAVKICQTAAAGESNVVFHANPEDFWNCNCVTYPVMESMPTNNILISHQPVEVLHCVLENGKWTAFCVGRKHAVFVRGFDSRNNKDFWYFDENYLFETVYQ